MERIEALTILSLNEDASDAQIVQAYQGKTRAIQNAFAQQEAMPDVIADHSLREQLALKFHQIQLQLDAVFVSFNIDANAIMVDAETTEIPTLFAQEDQPSVEDEVLSKEFEEMMNELSDDTETFVLDSDSQHDVELEPLDLMTEQELSPSLDTESLADSNLLEEQESLTKMETDTEQESELLEGISAVAAEDQILASDETDAEQENIDLVSNDPVNKAISTPEKASSSRSALIVLVLMLSITAVVAVGFYSGQLNPLLRKLGVPEMQFIEKSTVVSPEKKQTVVDSKEQ